MKDLFDAGLHGRLPVFISNFLKDRQFQVRLGSNLSTLFYQEMGVPQGSILSVTLFALKINSMRHTVYTNRTVRGLMIALSGSSDGYHVVTAAVRDGQPADALSTPSSPSRSAPMSDAMVPDTDPAANACTPDLAVLPITTRSAM